MSPILRVLSVLTCAVVLTACSHKADEAPASKLPASAASIARGHYLTQLADCFSCHSAPGKGAFSGGAAIMTPYGKIYGSNITPDKATGIGLYSRDDFYRVLHDGRRRDGAALYPAMPYSAYQRISREDSDAIYDYLMSRPAIKRANQPLDFSFPFNIRLGMHFWQWFFFDEPKEATPAAPELRRGAYIANALAHCSECHTPRNFAGALRQDAFLQGAKLGRFDAPAISPQALAERGWSNATLAQFLHTGLAPQGSAYGEMQPAIANSLRYLTPTDLSALVAYLAGPGAQLCPAPLASVSLDTSTQQNGQRLYAMLCAGCHGFDGQGKPYVTPTMQGNSSLRLSSPNNVLQTVLFGLPGGALSPQVQMQSMPGVPSQVSDQDVADLVNTLRAQWGGQRANVSAQTVAQMRSAHAE